MPPSKSHTAPWVNGIRAAYRDGGGGGVGLGSLRAGA